MRFFRFLLLGCLMVMAVAANAQTYPDKSKPVRIIVPFGAGISVDLLARAMSRAMSEQAGLNVVVDNRPGGEAIIGAQAAKAAAPDGYTIFLGTISTQAMNPHMFDKLPYDPIADFIPLVGVGTTPLMVNLGPTTSFKNVREFIAAARTSPGKYTLGIASSFTRLTAEVFQKAAGVDMLVVPHKNLTDAVLGLASSQLDMVIVDSATAGPYYTKGVRPIATTGATRTNSFPNTPTLREEGLADFEVVGWFAAYFPAKTPAAVTATMREILKNAVKSKYVSDVRNNFAMEPLELTGDQLDAFQRSELEKWGKAIRAANMGPKP
ncbi:MAG: hypothetical protein RL300_174 [Pseudomonadota bacterium]|jgi:tripartite-type tricarboxylate transporter receptor subunit TctC